MGMLIEGEWQDVDQRQWRESGAFERDQSAFRDWVRADSGSEFVAEPGRYHLLVTPGCPCAHRTVIARRLKKLEDAVAITVSDLAADNQGWAYSRGIDGVEPIDGVFHLHQLYSAAKSDYTGRVTVPTLWDLKTHTIVNNESSEIIRMFNSAFDAFGDTSVDLYPEALRAEIDALNAVVYKDLNNGVYRAGFSKTQAAYDEACRDVFDCLDMMEKRLSRQRYLVGGALTEADWRAYPTLVRSYTRKLTGR